MKWLLAIAFFIVSCGTQSKESMQHEYDSLVSRIHLSNKVIDGELRFLKEYNNLPDSMVISITRRADSIRHDISKMEKIKNELEEKLYK